MSRKPCLPFILGACLIIGALIFGVLQGARVFASGASSPKAALTVKPAADAYVISTAASSNYGASASLRVDGSPVTRSYLRFTVSGLNGAAIQAAKLRVYANSASPVGLTVNRLTSANWTENALTYNNAPPPGSAIQSSAAFAAGAWVTLDVSSYIKAEGTYNLVLTTSGATNVNLAARESGANAPQLIITAGAPPAPTATRTPVPTQPPAPTLPPVATQPPSTQPPAPTATSSDWQPTFPIRAAFYYPWFPEAWTQQGISPYTNYTPTLGYYSSNNQDILKKHIGMMQYGNIEAGISSWWGQGSHTDRKFAGLLSAAAGTRFRWAIYYENESQGDPSATQIHNDLVYIRDHYGKDPSFLRVNGKFVVFVYAGPKDTCGMVSRWDQGNNVGAFVVLKVFPGFAGCAGQPDSWHQYSPAVAADHQTGFSYTISPGFWLKGQKERLPRDLNRWTQNVKDMVSTKAPWQLITTFSEWGEGTIVESAKQWASPSGYGSYLDVLHEIPTVR